MKRILFYLFVMSCAPVTFAQDIADRPKAVVGIVVDQMRQEYLYRFYEKFGDGGFRRMMNDGFMVKNGHYNYAPTYTGPGHASVYTGATPSVHGIIGNDFYDKYTRRMVNCVEDGRYKPVGNEKGNGDVSPARMQSTTITDELKIFTQKRARVIGVSIKDRGAVLPAGHMADGAYWYDHNTGQFITSTFYRSDLPGWLNKFHQRKLADGYLNQDWNTLYPIEQYTASGPDDSPYENKFKGKAKPVFPYNLRELRAANGNYDLLVNTPFANDYLTELALAAIEGEGIGSDNTTDFLTISYSTPDAIGHSMGPNSVEVEDTYLRLDKAIEGLLKTLDEKVGTGSYTVFLTADHGVAEVPQYLRDNKVPAGYFHEAHLRANLEAYLLKYFPGREIIENMSNGQIFLNASAFAGDLRSSGVDMLIATELIMKYLTASEGIANVYSENMLRQTDYDAGGIKGMVGRGYHTKRSGDIAYVLEPGWFEGTRVQGSTH
ncbi:MAG TPA: alkaline phosphatase family protein, partial [Ohtaekwangia sp.]|nr:alkaline phosphatase family protein [Ohtaekwangia sp.]